MLPLLLFSSGLVSAMPDITIKRSASGYTAAASTFDARITGDVDAEISRRAAELCRDQQVRWGKFSSQAKLGKHPSTEAAPVTDYIREFSCAPVEQSNYEPAPTDWQPNARDLQEARAFFERYYAERDSGDFLAALQMFAPSARGDSASWPAEMFSFNAKLGPGGRRITAVSWELNPEAAEHPGVYVAIDFVGDYPSTYFYCGYLGLYRRAPGSYEIVREEQNQFARADGKADPAQVAQMRAAMCRGD